MFINIILFVAGLICLGLWGFFLCLLFLPLFSKYNTEEQVPGPFESRKTNDR